MCTTVCLRAWLSQTRNAAPSKKVQVNWHLHWSSGLHKNPEPAAMILHFMKCACLRKLMFLPLRSTKPDVIMGGWVLPSHTAAPY